MATKPTIRMIVVKGVIDDGTGIKKYVGDVFLATAKSRDRLIQLGVAKKEVIEEVIEDEGGA